MLRWPYCLIFIVLSFLVGNSIPAFYDWTGSDQSRSPAVVGYTALGLTAGVICIWAALPWLPVDRWIISANSPAKIRINIRTMFILTGCIAVLVAALMRLPFLVSLGMYFIAMSVLVGSAIRDATCRVPTATLVAIHYLPYFWLVTYPERPQVTMESLSLLAGVPAPFPAAILAGLARHQSSPGPWMALLLTSFLLVLGSFIIRSGPRLTIAYMVLALLLSTFGSFIVNALVRM